MNIAIDCVHYPISPRISSHRSSWARYWKWALQVSNPGSRVDILGRNDHDKWEDYDEVYFYQGMEWNGKLNLAGGVSDYALERIRAYAKTKFKKIFSIEVEMPDYYRLMKDRKIDDITFKDSHNIKIVEIPNTSKIVLGDSHALSVMNTTPESLVKVYRTDFKTLNGALNTGLVNIQNINWGNIDYCTFFFGMIDLRHHVFRYEGLDTIDKLCERYEDQLKEISKLGAKIELAELYPMTKNDRKIPKSGWYKGSPYFGSIEDRVAGVSWFNQSLERMCIRNNWDFYKQPKIIQDQDGTMDEYFMERPRSVHTSPEFYRFNLEEGKIREW